MWYVMDTSFYSNTINSYCLNFCYLVSATPITPIVCTTTTTNDITPTTAVTQGTHCAVVPWIYVLLFHLCKK